MAKLNPANGELIWETRFDAHPGIPGACPPADMRKQECMYKISELDDGGLVVCGNTSDNFDDFYLAKLKPDCQAKVAYANLPLDPNNEFHITTPTTWSSDMNVHGKIVVDQGATLTVTNAATIRFADSEQLDHPTQLVVEQGGRLTVNGNAKLTSMDQCPASMWDGIKVKGNYFASQDPIYNTPQGLASLSLATIENARVALVSGGPASFDDPTGPVIKEWSGGVVRASFVLFRNNRYDAVFQKYENHSANDPSNVQNNRSYFNQCSFAEDAMLNDGNSPKDHVYLNGVRGITMTACTFAGFYQPDVVFNGPAQVGTGIRSINSSFNVFSKCAVIVQYGFPCPPASVLHSTFDKLGQAVVATAFTPDKTFIVDQSIFTNCPRAIRTEGVRNAAITRNAFNVVDHLNPYVVSTPYGAYLDQCTGYKIENNAFTSNGSAHKSRVGLVIKDSGPEYNTFYNNTFDNFGTMTSVGSLIQGQNANEQVNYHVGLEVKCNEYGQFGGDNRFDVALTGPMPTVQQTQGGFDGQNDPLAPAGNLFSLEGHAESDWDVSNESNFISYYSHDGNIGDSWIPQFYDQLYVHVYPQQVDWPQERSQACPDNFDNDGRLEKMQKSAEADAELADSKDAYDATKDNGDTYSLESYVADPGHSSTQVRNALQSVAPKVSTEVWKRVFAREPAMDPWPLTQALVANSPLQPEVMNMSYESDLDDFYFNLVESAQSGDVNVLSQMESEMAKYAAEKGEALTDLGRMSWLDTTDVGAAMEYLKLWHDSLPADDGASVKAGYYAAKDDMPALYSLAEAEKLTSSTPEVFEVLKRYADHQLNAPNDSLDAGTVQWLTDLAEERWTIGSAQASAWLQGATGADALDEVIILPEDGEQRSTSQRRVRNRTSETPLLLQAYPNPSDGPVYVVCNVPDGVEQARLCVADLNGRLVKEIVLNNGAGIAEIRPGFAAAGIYLAELRLDGIRAGQVKLALQ
ncbi:MAG: T9SS type A sorting domain-containing protein [Flavobacteriales bacterium]|nr:T9SS type A sorting domain-containing protein [Flavobacteriales bacterium]